MSDYTVYTLDKPEAMAYLRKCLAAGHILSEEILRAVNIDDGYITVALPQNANPERLYAFDAGGILPPAPKSEWVESAHGSWEPVTTFKMYVINIIHSLIIRMVDISASLKMVLPSRLMQGLGKASLECCSFVIQCSTT